MDSKNSLLCWIIIAIIAILLWYRNYNLDRPLAIFIFCFSLVYLIEYGVYNGACPSSSGQTFFILMWVQCLVLALSIYVFLKESPDGNKTLNTVSLISVIFFIFVLIVAIIYVFYGNSNLHSQINKNGLISWFDGNGPMFGYYLIIYFIGIILPLILVLFYYKLSNITIWLLLLYIVIAILIIYSQYKPEYFGTIWAYLFVGIVFLIFFCGLFKKY